MTLRATLFLDLGPDAGFVLLDPMGSFFLDGLGREYTLVEGELAFPL
jgi:hypothetical protein